MCVYVLQLSPKDFEKRKRKRRKKAASREF